MIFLNLFLNLNELNGAKLDKNNTICTAEFKNVKILILDKNGFEDANLVSVKNFKVLNLAFLMKDLKYKLSLQGWTFVANIKHNYIFVDHTSKAKSVYEGKMFEYLSRYLIAKLVKEKNMCIYEIELK
ncbi:MAG: hypothetical protein ABIL49_06620 [candidate division WOR-3 bacterium]|jgi:hypothetical protein